MATGIGKDPVGRIVQNLFTIQRLGNTIEAEGRVLLDALFDQLAFDIESINPTGPRAVRWRNLRRDELFKKVKERLGKTVPEWEAAVARETARAGASQGAWASQTLVYSLGETVAKGVVRKTPITVARAAAILHTNPFGGASGKHVLTDWASGLETSTLEAIKKQIRAGMLAEEGIPDLVRRVRGARKGWRLNALGQKVPNYLGGVWTTTTRDATAIVRTAVTAISSTAQLETYQANAEVLKGIEYSAALDDRTTEICLSLDGEIWPVDSPKIVVPGVDTHMQCVVGETKVLSRFGIAGASKRWFDGEVVVIRTASGRELSCTPNHPILTDSGWVAAGLLNVGNNVVSDSGSEWESAVEVDGDGENVPALIHDVTESLFRYGEVMPEEVITATPDFHGDGREGEVTIIGTDRELFDRLHASFLKHIGQEDFPFRDLALVPVSSLSEGTPMLEALLPASASIVSSSGESLPFHSRTAVHPDLLLLMAVPEMESSPFEYSTYGTGGNTETLSNTSHADSVPVETDDIILWENDPTEVCGLDAVSQEDPLDDFVGDVEALGNAGNCLPILVPLNDRDGIESPLVSPYLDPPGLESVGYGLGADAELASQILSGATGEVFLDQVVSIERRQWSGHVFNLETGSGFYAANGIITHNCRSALVPVVDYEKFGMKPPPDGYRKARDLKGFSEKDLKKKISVRRRKDKDLGRNLLGPQVNVRSSVTAETWLKDQPALVQNKMLGKGKAQLFRDGKVGLKDMVRSDLSTVPLRDLGPRVPTGVGRVAFRQAPRATTFAEAEAYATEVGAPIVPGTKSAALDMMEKSYKRIHALQPDASNKLIAAYNAKRRAKDLAYWEKALGDGVSKLSSDGRLFFQNTINQAYGESPAFRSVVGKYGDVANIPVDLKHVPKTVGGFENALAVGADGQYIRGQGTTFLFPAEEWTGGHKLLRGTPSPGVIASTESVGQVAAVHHEYGHFLFMDRMSVDFKGRWADAFKVLSREKMEKGLTWYAAENRDEAFSELFAMMMSPRFNRAAFPSDIQPLIDMVLEVLP